MKKLNIFAPVDDPTGYAEMSREIIYEMWIRGMQMNLQKFERWCGQKTTTPIDNLLALLKELPYNQETPLLSICLPEQVPLDAHNLNVNFSMFEVDGIPKNWVDSCKQIDHIILTSKFCKDAWVNSGVPENKISVVGLGVNTVKYNPLVPHFQLYTEEGIPLQDKYKYRVMNIQEIVERKNLDGILSAWYKSKASKRDDCCLILKLSSYSGDKLDYFKGRVERLKSSLGSTGCNNVYTYTNILVDGMMPAFIRNATHYISMSYGEGWDLNVMKAGAMCKIVCAPNNTSYTEYLNEENSYLIPIKRKELAKQTGPTARLYKNLNWFVPDEDYVINFFDTLGENGEKAASKVKAFYEDIRTKWTWGNTTTGVLEVLDKVVSEKKTSKRIKTVNDGVASFCKSLNPGISRCGIANYSLSLHNAVSKQYPALLAGGIDNRYLSVLDDHPSITVVHLQNEYQFHSKARLKHLLGELNNRGINSIVTQHTVTRRAIEYNDVLQNYADHIIVHSERSKQEWDGMYGEKDSKCKVIPMGCMPFVTDEELKDVKLPDEAKIKNQGKFTIGFFGFTYYHKGIDKLMLSYKILQSQRPDTYLLLLANKPLQDAVRYSERCEIIAKMFGIKEEEEYLWIKDYLDELQVIKYLKKCDIVILPYDEYGGIGTSAAIRTCLRAGVPIVTSDTCWFSDVDAVERFDLEKLQQVVVAEYQNKDNQIHKFKRINAQKKFLIENSFENVAKKHVELYKQITGRK